MSNWPYTPSGHAAPPTAHTQCAWCPTPPHPPDDCWTTPTHSPSVQAAPPYHTHLVNDEHPHHTHPSRNLPFLPGLLHFTLLLEHLLYSISTWRLPTNVPIPRALFVFSFLLSISCFPPHSYFLYLLFTSFFSHSSFTFSTLSLPSHFLHNPFFSLFPFHLLLFSSFFPLPPFHLLLSTPFFILHLQSKMCKSNCFTEIFFIAFTSEHIMIIFREG